MKRAGIILQHVTETGTERSIVQHWIAYDVENNDPVRTSDKLYPKTCISPNHNPLVGHNIQGTHLQLSAQLPKAYKSNIPGID